MSVETSPRIAWPKWGGPVLFVAAVGIVFALSNHSPDTKTPEGLYVVADEDAYNKSIDRAKNISASALQHYHDGLQLTPEEVSAIREAAQLVDQASLYKPNLIAPYYLGGTAHAAIGELEKADEELRQGILDAKGSTDQKILAATVDAHYERSRILFQLGKYQDAYNEATIAASAIPNAPDYLVARAKAALQIGRKDIAEDEVSAALTLDPNNPGAKVLSKFLGPKTSKKHP